MTTIHPKALAGMIVKGQPFELIDLRSRQEFDKSHIRGARSIPLPKLHSAGVTRARGLMNPAPLFLISCRSIQASLGAGILRGSGCLRPVIVAGGMDLWEAQGFPTVHPWRFHVAEFRQRVHGLIGHGLIKLFRMLARALVHRPPDQAWWCRYGLQPRKAYRG